MFRRRKPLTKLQQIREVFWPSMGWRRALRYLYLRIVRMSGTTYSIAAGLSIGVAVCFNPFLGTHFLQAIFFAWLLRANIMAALVATCVENPWTFSFMWWGAIKFGSWIFSFFGIAAGAALPPHMNLPLLWETVLHEPLRIFLPWLVGGYLIGLISLFLTYPLFYRLVKAAQQARRVARLYKIHQVAHEITDQHA